MSQDTRHQNVLIVFFFVCKRVSHLRGSFPWARLGSGPLHPEGLYLGWGQGPTPSTAFDDRMGSSPPPGVKPGSMTIGPQGSYQTSYHIPSTITNVGLTSGFEPRLVGQMAMYFTTGLLALSIEKVKVKRAIRQQGNIMPNLYSNTHISLNIINTFPPVFMHAYDLHHNTFNSCSCRRSCSLIHSCSYRTPCCSSSRNFTRHTQKD
ncbi:hypothetical protein YC2023_099142 [Brassica napus]